MKAATASQLHNGHKYPPSTNALGHFLGDLYACASARGACRLKFVGMQRDCTVVLPPVGSDFQRRVWAELCAIPYGTTTNAQALAADISNHAALRAVAAANSANAIFILIPCTASSVETAHRLRLQ